MSCVVKRGGVGALWRRSRRWLLGTVMGLALLGGVGEAAIQVTGGTGLSFAYVRGYSLQSGWLCYGWANGTLHCTRYVRWVGGVAHSGNPAWVPDSLPNHPTVAQNGYTSSADKQMATNPPKGIAQWAKPPENGFQVYDVLAIHGNKSALLYPFGQCTWGAAYLGHGNLTGLGNAYEWAWNAAKRGMATGTQARAGATVVFQGGMQGASYQYGHVAHVVQVYTNGWFLVEEMNFAGVDHGGWGRFSWRYAHEGYGVSFIYS